MELKTKQQLKEEGFKFVAINENTDMEVWARFTGWQDCIQYIDYKEGIYTGDAQTTSFNRLCLMGHMLNAMREDYLIQGINEKDEDKIRWKNKYDSYV